MSSSRFMRGFIVALCLSMIVTVALAQQQESKEYVPVERQAGKDVVWVPTAQALVDKMLDMAKVTPQDFVVDLGSGDGRTVITAAKRGARALGVEYNPDMVELSKRNAAKEGVSDRAEFVKADLYETDFSKATVVTLFLLPEINYKLRPKILDMKPGTRIVSNSFDMAEWKPDETYRVDDYKKCQDYCTAYFWVVPAKVDGTWKLSQGELLLQQSFQFFSGTINTGGKPVSIVNGRLDGDQISFTAGTARYSGRVIGAVIEGTMEAGGKTSQWKAIR